MRIRMYVYTYTHLPTPHILSAPPYAIIHTYTHNLQWRHRTQRHNSSPSYGLTQFAHHTPSRTYPPPHNT